MTVLAFALSAAVATADEIDELISDEVTATQGELLQAIQARDTAIEERNAAIQACDEALLERDDAVKRAEKAEKLAASLRAGENSSAEILASSDFSNKDKTLEELRKELVEVLAESRKDRIKLSYNLACVYKASRQHKKAEAEFLKALSLSPDDPGIHYNLGILYDDTLGNAQKAKYHYRRFLDLAPNDRDAGRVVEWLAEL